MRFISQIRNIQMQKWLELQNCAWSVTVKSQYVVKAPCNAIINSKGGIWNQREVRSWEISLHAVYMRVHKVLRVFVGWPRRTSCRSIISQTCSMGDVSSERTGQGCSDVRRSLKKKYVIRSWLKKGLVPPYMATTLHVAWIRRRRDHILYPMTAAQTITLDVCSTQIFRFHSPR